MSALNNKICACLTQSTTPHSKLIGYAVVTGLAALLHCELAVDVRLPGAAAPLTTLHVPVRKRVECRTRDLHQSLLVKLARAAARAGGDAGAADERARPGRGAAVHGSPHEVNFLLLVVFGPPLCMWPLTPSVLNPCCGTPVHWPCAAC